MLVQFWGVRGSIPVPGPDTIRYGGNTPCLTVSIDDFHTLVLDAGSGIASFGRSMPDRDHTYFILFSHIHWDHIQGLPLFAPLMSPRTRLVFLTGMEPAFMDGALDQLDGVHFPVPIEACQASLERGALSSFRELEQLGLSVSWMPTRHSGTCFAYRISGPSADLVYMTDNELGPDTDNMVAFCKNADILIHDAQYTEDERSEKSGWGHSFLPDVCAMAQQASVKELVLFHHDPERTDTRLDDVQADARTRLGPTIPCHAAREGMQRHI